MAKQILAAMAVMGGMREIAELPAGRMARMGRRLTFPIDRTQTAVVVIVRLRMEQYVL
jgi:hypothetical protein